MVYSRGRGTTGGNAAGGIRNPRFDQPDKIVGGVHGDSTVDRHLIVR